MTTVVAARLPAPATNPRRRRRFGRTAVLAACAALGAGCFPSTPGVDGVAGTPPAANVPWSPPTTTAGTAPAPAPSFAIPPDLAERVEHLSLADVVDVALRFNTLTAASWASARAAAASYGAARGQYYPTIALGASATSEQPVFAPNIKAATYRDITPAASLSWLLLDFGSRSGAIGEAREALVAADWTHNATIQSVVLAVETSYFTYVATKALLSAQETTLKEAQTNLEAAQERHRVGVATIADVLQAQTAVSEAQLALESTQGAIETTRGALALSMGLPANLPYDIAAAAPAPPPLGITDSVNALIDRALQARPDLMAARAQARAAAARVTATRGAALPSLVLSGNGERVTFLNPTNSVNGYAATLALQIPLFSGWSQIYNVRAAAASAQAAQQQESLLEQEVTYQVFVSFYALRTATQQARTSADLMASATQSEAVALGRYRAGAGSLLDLLTAQSALAAARAQDIQARFSWYTAAAQLAHDAGILRLDGSAPLHVQTDTSTVR